MIWYELSKNRIRVPNRDRYTLICTHLSLTELALTGNLFGNLEEVQKAVRAILSVECDFNMHYPLDHARKLIDKDFVFKYNIEEDLVMAFIRAILNQPKEGLIENSLKQHLLKISARRQENSNDWSDFINKLNQPMKDISYILKRYREENSYQENFKKTFLFHLNQLSEKEYTDNLIDWSLFELYEKVGARYHRNMLLSKMKADRNDESDLKNMIYVQPGDKYWTLEKRWLSIIKEVSLEQYLYIQE
jgi:hypothetical protein